MKPAQACDPNTGTRVFQRNDQVVSYIESVLNFEELDFTEFEAVGLENPNPILELLGG
jgi:hypothetical protein